VREQRSQYRAPLHVEASSNFEISIEGNQIEISPGQRYPNRGFAWKDRTPEMMISAEGYNLLIDTSGCLTEEAYSVAAGTLAGRIRVDFDGTPCFEISESNPTLVSQEQGQTNFELFYSGTDDQTLRITYRECTDDNIARSPFFQELTYPANTNIVRFRDFVIEVEPTAADGALSFTVINDGGLEALNGTRISESYGR
jgi:hypothetical protein